MRFLYDTECGYWPYIIIGLNTEILRIIMGKIGVERMIHYNDADPLELLMFDNLRLIHLQDENEGVAIELCTYKCEN